MTDDAPPLHHPPLIPTAPEEPPIPPRAWRVFGSKAFFRLWLAQVVSSTGDWIGLIAILAVAARVSNNSGAAVSLVMTTRVLPGFLLGTVGGVVIDRFDRRKVMVLCDVGRASLLVLLPFVESLPGLLLVSLGLEILTLLWGPAQAASVPNLVPEEQYSSANSLSLAASYGTFPIAGIIFSVLAATSRLIGEIGIVSSFKVDQQNLALAFDALTYIVSALIVWKLPIPRRAASDSRRIDWTETFREIRDGLRFVSHDAITRGVMLGLGFGLIGAGAMVPLGPSFAVEGLRGGSAAYGVLLTALGVGAAIGVVTLLWLQRRVPRLVVFCAATAGTGVSLLLAASFSALGLAVIFVVLVGGCAGTTYVTGFTVLQEHVSDEMRGRTFATLYTVVRLCLLISLTISPLWADFWDWVTGKLFTDQIVEIGSYAYHLPGVRIALWGGGVITLAAGIAAYFSIFHDHDRESATGDEPPSDGVSDERTGAHPAGAAGAAGAWNGERGPVAASEPSADGPAPEVER